MKTPLSSRGRPMGRFGLALAAACALASAGRADPAPPAPPTGFYRFNLAPRSMQTDPLLDITVMTDVTDAGKKLPEVTKDRPAYYLAHSEGFQEHGEGTPSGQTLGEDDMGRLLRRSLASGGYLESQDGGPAPTLVVLYSWGLYSKRIDTEQGLAQDGQDMKEMFDRAELVGGDDFARKIVAMIKWKAAVGASSTHHRHTSNIADPMYVYELESTAHARMLEMANSDLYFVIASAYDYAAYRRHQSVLLWRTRIAIDAGGVSQPQVLPTMVMGAGAYFGKETKGDPTLLTRHAIGQVEIGELKVVSYGTPTAAPDAPPAEPAATPASPAPAPPSSPAAK